MKHFLNGISLSILGLSLGWLIGLSVSPILQIIVSSLITLAIAAVSVLSGIKKKEVTDSEATIFPLSLITLFIAVGASLGILARTNNILGIRPSIFASQWKETGIKENELKKKLFLTLYPDVSDNINLESNSSNEKSKSDSAATNAGDLSNHKNHNDDIISKNIQQYTAGLYAFSVSDCALLVNKHGKELKTVLLALDDKRIDSLVKICGSDDCLELIKTIVCAKN